ncbi:thiopurine S-methyltransferase [Kushneria indalinina]|uniref:thiopurine S-methyltransferase n=1 Tax=Kushneria indalinina DSM 14324 TaxID=1122140 RepID=A0A3D9E0P9_9GAMM|nr:thiopurine S-methyltransferase [Kushneria indalinina]REC96632.1 thiopurine S-methyltransferase [Kushneria indalinina DSM 14324]
MSSASGRDNEQWFERWREGRIGFHSDSVQPMLARYWSCLQAPPGARVLLPLCGKSGDIHWLAQCGHPVLGIELVEEAVRGWFTAQGEMLPRALSRTNFNRFESPERSDRAAVSLDVGNFFHLETGLSDSIDAFHDRAALIALPEAARQRYALKLAELCRPGVEGLLISVVRDERRDQGPPYVVTDEEVERLFAPNFELERLGEQPDERGMTDIAWRLRRKAPLSC